MTKLKVTNQVVHGADLGPENPLPALGTLGEIQNVPAEPSIPDEVKQNLNYGRRSNPLPYTVQDGYSRARSDKTLTTIVLENDRLEATFLPEYGGRLWSLVDKAAGRDLVYENPVFQPANLAIRNAWLSGGVEWNIGLRGHSPFTCSDVFAARVDGPDGTPILRMYEYERIRQVPYLVDFILPEGSPLLYVHVRIVNPHDDEIPMYWWSNIAYPEHPKTRVVTPAERAYRFGYGQAGLGLRDVPVIEGVDVTYSVNLGHSADFFFDIPPEQRKWIAAIDEDGSGLFQASTDRLMGRKLFVWGTGPGGNAWQEFLSVKGTPYIEIQAGLAHTQLEHIRMPAKAQWSWLEAYGRVQADPTAVHQGSWADVRSVVGEQIERTLPREKLDRRYREAGETSRLRVSEILHRGSGWGALETAYRAWTGAPALAGPEIDFGSDVGPAAAQWLELLREGTFPRPPVLDEPVGYEVEPKWQTLLEPYVKDKPDNWYAQLHLGLMRFERGNIDGAREAWEASVAAADNPWAHRNLGALADLRGDLQAAVASYRRAFELQPGCTPLAVEYGRMLLKAGLPGEWIDVYASLPANVREQGRFQLLYAQALLETDRLDDALEIVKAEPEVTDLREGENSLTDIWYRIHERKLLASGEAPEGDLRDYVQENYPPPARIDFRMRTKKDAT